MIFDPHKKADSISGRSAEHFISNDESLASLLISHGIQVRDFIVLSFLSDQGPMSVARLSRTLGIEPRKILRGVERLSAANLLIREPSSNEDKFESIAKLTSRGEDVAKRVSDQLE